VHELRHATVVRKEAAEAAVIDIATVAVRRATSARRRRATVNGAVEEKHVTKAPAAGMAWRLLV
jgi:thiazole synthase ThiGH ThiG subunit